MKKKSRGPTEHRSYGRLTLQKKNQIELMLDRGKSCRQIACELGRAPLYGGLRGSPQSLHHLP